VPLSEDKQLERIAEALFIERMKLSPEIHMTLSVLLESFRWIKMLCEKESKPFQDITPEFLIRRITGQEVQAEQLMNVKKEVEEQMQNGGPLQPKK
jgi:hypothetical protein